MPVVANIKELVGTRSESANRTLILVDLSKSLTVYSHFSYPYDHRISTSAVAQLFDDTVSKLTYSGIDFHDESSLPIVAYVGMYEKTLITKSIAGEITISDAAKNNVEQYMGLG